MRHFVIGIVGCALLMSPVGIAPTVAAEPAVEMLAQRQRSSGRRYTYSTPSRTTRTYRSYSVEPGAPAESGTIVESPTPRTYSSPRPSTRSKPSYMRGDAKARGQFGQ